jgi:AcrR family transcriptional regulator
LFFLDREANNLSLTGTKRERARDQLLVSTQSLLMEYNASALDIRQITTHAGMPHASFFDYYPDVPALIGDLGELLGATHAAAMIALGNSRDDPAVRFAQNTRQTLRIAAQQPVYGHLMFDVGLATDRLGSELLLRLKFDIGDGVSRGIFVAADIDMAASMVAGAISGLALDLHRRVLSVGKIDVATAKLLIFLGLDRSTAELLSCAPIDFPPPPDLPLRWLALPPCPQWPEADPSQGAG